MNKFQNGDKVLILGDSIGGWNYKFHTGVVVDHVMYNHYRISIGGREITYSSDKLDIFTPDVAIMLIEDHIRVMNNLLNEYQTEEATNNLEKLPVKVTLENIDDLIDQWHESDVNTSCALYEYLGLTWEQWVNYGVTGQLPK